MIFQDPFASLNPQMQLMDQVAEPMRNYGLDQLDQELQDRVQPTFLTVWTPAAVSFMRRYPHEIVRWSTPAHRDCPSPWR